jgi:hypothetical protein
MHNLAIGHLLIVVRIHYLEQDDQVFLLVKDAHLNKKLSELVLVKDPIPVAVHLLEDLSELVQEFLMLSQLKVEDGLLELGIGQLLLYHICIKSNTVNHFLP